MVNMHSNSSLTARQISADRAECGSDMDQGNRQNRNAGESKKKLDEFWRAEKPEDRLLST